MPLQVRRGPTVDRLSITPLNGELIFDTDQNALYVGDGSTPGGVPGSEFTAEDARNVTADLFSNGSHTNVSFNYDSIEQRIDATIDLSSYLGIIEAEGFRGDIFSEGGRLLVDATNESFDLNETIRTNIIPFDDDLYSLGNFQNRFTSLHLSGSDLFLANAQITAVGTTIDLPAGSTIDGILIGTDTGNGNGNGIVEGESYRINIISSDGSTLIVNSFDNSINALGGITGNLTGSIFSDDGSTIILNSSNNSVTAPGGIIGDLSGSVVAADFTIMVDATNKAFLGTFDTGQLLIEGNRIYDSVSPVNISSENSTVSQFIGITNGSDRPINIDVNASKGTTDIPTDTVAGDQLGALQFRGFNDNEYKNAISLLCSWTIDADLTDNNPKGQLIIGTGNNNGGFTSMSFNGDGVLSSPIVQTGSYTTTERDALTPAFGMMIYNTTTNTFQGYQNTSGTTPEWVNLS